MTGVPPKDPRADPVAPEGQQNTSLFLLQKWCSGDEAAATALYNRYAQQLVELVSRQLARSPEFNQRFDAEDVMQSALKSLFLGVRDGRFLLQHSGQLWSLLARIALHKMKHWKREHLAQKRSVNRERSAQDDTILAVMQALGNEQPLPAQSALMVTEEVERLLDQLEPLHGRMFALRLAGHTYQDIAERVGRSERAVRKVLVERIEPYLNKRLLDTSS